MMIVARAIVVLRIVGMLCGVGASNLRSSEQVNKTGSDGLDKQPDPSCKRGVVSPDLKACCASECGNCGTHKLCGEVGKYHEATGKLADQCCKDRILKKAPSCDEDHPPCVLSPSYKKNLNKYVIERPKRHASDDCNKAIPIVRAKHALSIERGEFFSKLFLEGTTKYVDAKALSIKVRGLCEAKARQSEELVARYSQKVSKANAEDKQKDKLTGVSNVMQWTDKRDNEKAEVKFYNMIIENSKDVQKMANKGILKVKPFKADVQPAKDLSEFYVKLNALIDDANLVFKDAELLWKQWKDASKDYNCGAPPAVAHAKSQCEAGNTKFSPKCAVTCMPGYDGEGTQNALRCNRQGKFGKQLYGEWMGMASCIPRNCGKPPKIGKAKTVIVDIFYPHAAAYNCYEGFSTNRKPNGPKSFTVSCDATGHFTQNAQVCKAITCGGAPVMKNAEVSAEPFHYTELATYRCLEGHTVDETAGGLKSFQRSCQATGKFSAGLSCKPVRCGPSPDFAKTELMDATKHDQFYGDKLDYQCEAGYTIDQRSSGPDHFTLVCPADGEFAAIGTEGGVPLPKCRPMSAGMAPKIAHGKFNPREMFYGESALVTVNSGYSLSGNPGQGVSFTLDVTTQGKYSGLETFIPVVCGKPPSVEKATTKFAGAKAQSCQCIPCGSSQPKNFGTGQCGSSTQQCSARSAKTGGCYSSVNSSCNCKTLLAPGVEVLAMYGDVLNYACNEGYSTDGVDEEASKSFSIQCESDASLSQIPGFGKCITIDDCEGITCGPRGTCVDHVRNYTCSCESGFEQRMDYNTRELTCGNIDDCGPEACGVGECVDLVNDYKCKCPTGHEQIDSDDNKDHTCQAVICGTPPEVNNAATSPIEVQLEKAYYQNKIVYQCGEGHTVDATATGKNHFSIKCQASRSFTEAKACMPIKCNEVPIVNKGRARKTKAVFNESVRFDCDSGYTIDGSATSDRGFTVTCQVNGEFGEPQECKPVTCGEPDNVAFASRPSGTMVYKDSVNYMCFDGYTLDGNKNSKSNWPLSCDQTGKFSRMKQCLPKICGVPADIHALYSSTKDEGPIRYPMNAEVICRDGYTVGGGPTGETTFTVRCTSEGIFAKYDERDCEPVRCGPPPAMANATFLRLDSPYPIQGGDINYEERAVYKCDEGFTTGGEHNAPTTFNVECLPSGQLSAPTPNNQCRNVNDCEQHTCGPKGQCVDLIGAAPAYTCQCDFGFELQTNNVGEKHCGNKDDCQGKGCGVGTCKDLIGDYTCICPSGFYIGVGSDGSKTCIPVQCSSSTPTLSNGRMLSSHSGAVNFPTTLRYKCATGYSVDGTVSESMRSFQAQCKPHGQLVGMSACQKISCGTAHVLPYTKLLSPSSPRRSIEYDDKAKYECFDGYTVGGRAGAKVTFQVKCQDSGVLTDPKVCEPVKCGRAPSVPKSRPSIAGDAFFGQNLVYSCDVGYSLTGNPQGGTEFRRHCKNDGAFSAISSRQPCNPISAGNAPTVTNAVMTEYAGRRVTSFPPRVFYPNGLEYRCDQGYSSNGSPSGPTKISARVNAIGQFVPALPTACKLITYVIRGQVKNARSGAQLNGVTVRIEGTNNRATVQSGHFILSNLRVGSVNIVYEMNGYITLKRRLSITGNVNCGGAADVSMSPAMRNDEWRAVLKWGSSPRDLDTYATWGSKKVYYGNKRQGGGGNQPRAVLEQDVTSGYGPETLYFSNIGKCNGACDIKYKIKDCAGSNTMLSKGEAEVTLYTGLKAAGTWKIKDCPRSVTNGGNWWHVFTLDGRTNRLKWTCTGAGFIQTTDLNHTIAPDSTNQTMPIPEKLKLPRNIRR